MICSYPHTEGMKCLFLKTLCCLLYRNFTSNSMFPGKKNKIISLCFISNVKKKKKNLVSLCRIVHKILMHSIGCNSAVLWTDINQKKNAIYIIFKMPHAVAVEMDEWENPAFLGAREVKETTSSPAGTVCSLKYHILPLEPMKCLKTRGFSASEQVSSCSFSTDTCCFSHS